MTSSDEILNRLREKADSKNLEGMKRYGMTIDKRLGVSVADMRLLVKGVPKNHDLALALWKTGLAEGKIIARAKLFRRGCQIDPFRF